MKVETNRKEGNKKILIIKRTEIHKVVEHHESSKDFKLVLF